MAYYTAEVDTVPEVTLEQLEKNLEKSSERLGLALKGASAEEKQILSSLYDKIRDLVAKQEAEHGDAVDASALFAAGIVGNEQIKDAEIIEAAINYIDQDLAYCRARSLGILEKNLESASERLGLALKNAPEEEKKVLSSLYDKIKDLVAKQVAEHGEAVDASALFAAGIVGNEQIKDTEVIEAAVNYIDQDLAYCRFRSEKK